MTDDKSAAKDDTKEGPDKAVEQPATGRLDRRPVSVHAQTRLEEERLLFDRALGATIDPVTSDFLFSTFGGGGVDSFDDVYRLDIDAAWIAVSHVRDEDLARLKGIDPARIAIVTVFLGAGLSGIGGVLIGTVSSLAPELVVDGRCERSVVISPDERENLGSLLAEYEVVADRTDEA